MGGGHLLAAAIPSVADGSPIGPRRTSCIARHAGRALLPVHSVRARLRRAWTRRRRESVQNAVWPISGRTTSWTGSSLCRCSEGPRCQTNTSWNTMRRLWEGIGSGRWAATSNAHTGAAVRPLMAWRTSSHCARVCVAARRGPYPVPV